ncbi:MAG: tRNA (adenosine(37)-N6)-threonylcarbamoyltransferase complex dimerization subunit type 1 TsaB [Methyloceanibacter sp.]|uniref:tRNA (adenosine(37)-N6)-threonylcarbamoyltransferase complex dimerization subunit type 1 TsaB n=1 Tax=Methyloceanibacter sp. TaxID=1965321 RepID=UPI003EE2708D
MNLLALDTSMGACSAAVLRTGAPARRLYVLQAEMARGHAEALMPMVEEVLAEAEIDARDLDLIAATVGPGSFTGVRIAIAAARGLALVTKAKLYGTDSLTVMARAARLAGLEPKGPFAVAVDARRDMLYLGLYDETGSKLEGPLLIAPGDAAGLLPATLRVAVGNGAQILCDAAATRGRKLETELPSLQPSAAALAEIALESGETSETVRPLYLRPPDAKPQAPALERR